MGKDDEFFNAAWKVYQSRAMLNEIQSELKFQQQCENLYELLTKNVPEADRKIALYDLYDMMRKVPEDLAKLPGFSFIEKEIISNAFASPSEYEQARRSGTIRRSDGAIVTRVGSHKVITHNASSDFAKFKIFLDFFSTGDPHFFVFHFRLGKASSFRGFPPGYQIGRGQLYSFVDMNPVIRDGMKQSAKKLFHAPSELKQAGSGEIDLTGTPLADLLEEDYDTEVFLRIEVTDSVGKKKAAEKAGVQATRSASVLKLFFGTPTDRFVGTRVERLFIRPTINSPFDYYDAHECKLTEKQIALGGFRFDGGWEWGRQESPFDQTDYKWQSKYDASILLINQILAKQKNELKEIEAAILNAIDIIGMIRESTQIHIKFVLCMIGLEGLLMGGTRDNLSYKLAERVSLLVGDYDEWIDTYRRLVAEKAVARVIAQTQDPIAARIGLNDLMVELYDKRSGFAHSGLDGKRAINQADYSIAFLILRWVLHKLLSLWKDGDGMVLINEKGSLKGRSLEEYIASKKYGMTGAE